HLDTPASLFTQVSTQHDALVIHQADLIATHTPALSRATDALASVQADYEAADELLNENRATIRALSSRPATDGGGRPVPISDPAAFNSTKEDLDTRVKELKEVLQAAFGDRDPRGTAQRQPAALRQGNQDFSCYLADFTRFSNCLIMPEETKIVTLRPGLSPGLKDEIRFRDEPKQMVEFIKLLKNTQIKMNLRKRKTRHLVPTTAQVPARPQRAPRLISPTMLEG
ncbi:hypothetical protein Q9L58_010602, partial [Maublancomyces gigas]